MLRTGASSWRIERFLIDWLVSFEDMPASLRQARAALRQALTDLLLRLEPTFSAEQRARLVGRLT